MIFTILNIILSVGSWEVEEYAFPKNVTLAPTINNRIGFNTVQFADDKVCSVLYNRDSPYTFNTEEDAMNNWNTKVMPFQLARYEERFHITSNTCYAFKRNNTSFTLIIVFFTTLGTILDVISILLFLRYKHHKQRIQQISPQGNPPLQEQEPIRRPYYPAQQQSKSDGLSIYAAQLIAEAYIHRRELCPITQEPLDKVSLLVPECGHVISESSGYISNTCCVCKRNVNYTRVEGKLTIVKSKQNDVDTLNV